MNEGVFDLGLTLVNSSLTYRCSAQHDTLNYSVILSCNTSELIYDFIVASFLHPLIHEMST